MWICQNRTEMKGNSSSTFWLSLTRENHKSMKKEKFGKVTSGHLWMDHLRGNRENVFSMLSHISITSDGFQTNMKNTECRQQHRTTSDCSGPNSHQMVYMKALKTLYKENKGVVRAVGSVWFCSLLRETEAGSLRNPVTQQTTGLPPLFVSSF